MPGGSAPSPGPCRLRCLCPALCVPHASQSESWSAGHPGGDPMPPPPHSSAILHAPRPSQSRATHLLRLVLQPKRVAASPTGTKWAPPQRPPGSRADAVAIEQKGASQSARPSLNTPCIVPFALLTLASSCGKRGSACLPEPRAITRDHTLPHVALCPGPGRPAPPTGRGGSKRGRSVAQWGTARSRLGSAAPRRRVGRSDLEGLPCVCHCAGAVEEASTLGVAEVRRACHPPVVHTVQAANMAAAR